MIWAYGALLVVWGNVVSSALMASDVLPGGSWPFAAAGVALVVVSLFAALRMRLPLPDVFFRRERAVPGLYLGAVVGIAAALVGVVGLRVVAPLIVGRHVDYAPLDQIVEADLLRHVLFFLPVGDVGPEELAFRGVLLIGLVRATSRSRAIAVSAIAFMLWHLATVFATVADTTIGPPSPWFLPAVVGALAVVACGGAVLSWLRLWTGNLLTVIAAHWAFNSVLLFGLWSTRPVAPAGCC